jgi:putative protease
MLILSPVDRASEVPALAGAGAEELYAGYNPPFWSEALGPVVSANRRSFEEASVPSLEELEALILTAAVRDVPISLALNVSPVPDGMLPRILSLVAGLAKAGLRGVIVSDLGLLAALRDMRFRRLAIHASTLFSAFNGAAVALLRRAGAGRVVLARELSVAEVGAITSSAAKGVEIEVIGMRGKCPNIEGFCGHLHDDPQRTWPCELRYEKSWTGPGGSVPKEVREALELREGIDRHYSCGLCAVPLLERAGVHAFKLVGRGAETERKVSAVTAVRRMREWGRQTIPDAPSCARAGKALYEEIFGRRCRREICYFPEFSPGEDRP